METEISSASVGVLKARLICSAPPWEHNGNPIRIECLRN